MLINQMIHNDYQETVIGYTRSTLGDTRSILGKPSKLCDIFTTFNICCVPPQVNPLCGVLPYAEFPNGGEPITKEPDTKSGSLAKNGPPSPGK